MTRLRWSGIVWWIPAILISVVLVGLGTRAAWHANLRAGEAHTHLEHAQSLAMEWQLLQSPSESAATSQWHASELPSVLSAALGTALVPASTLASFAATSAIPTADGLSRERAALVLNPITLPQLGRVLAAWQETEPHWAMTSIELSPVQLASSMPGAHSSTGGGGSGAGGDRMISASITLEALVREDPPEGSGNTATDSPRRGAPSASPRPLPQTSSKERPR